MVHLVTGEILWPFSMNSTIAQYANDIIAADNASQMITNKTNVVQVFNPFYAIYPAWHSGDVEFNKFIQCQKRMMQGLPNYFNSCSDTMATGRDDYSNIMNLLVYHGNDTIYLYNTPTAGMNVSGTSNTNEQYQAYFWDGILKYPYSYQGNTAGPDYHNLQYPVLFNKQYGMKMVLSQNLLEFGWQRDIAVSIPYISAKYLNESLAMTYQIRRFTEDQNTWTSLQLGTMHDMYGMVYQAPEGMTSFEKIAGVPAFVGTPHYYGNKLW